MPRVPWVRYSGEDVEAVVAMLVNRRHPNSVRISPSKGDGGVDILDRAAAPDGGDVVYQVKRYANPLTAKQKTEVEESIGRLFEPRKRDPRWAGLNVTEWRLVTPWDPTPEAETWLQELAATYGVPTAVWDGLTVVDGLCAQYPEVVDYYLSGGREEIAAAYRQALAFASLKDRDVRELPVRALAAHVADSLHGPLSRDPHYSYGFRSGTGEPSPPAASVGLVMSSYEVRREHWFAIDVIARCAASVDERPITVTGTLSASREDGAAEALAKFLEYGIQPDASFSFTGVLDAPGGLGGTLADATARVLPVVDGTGEKDELRLEVLDPEGGVLACAYAERADRGSGSRGVSFALREVNEVFYLSGYATLGSGQPAALSMRLELLPVAGKPAAMVVDALSFLAHLHEPNQLRTSARHTSAEHGARQPLTGVEPSDGFVAFAEAVAALNAIQLHTSQVLRVPDLVEHHGQVASWQRVARLLAGAPVSARYPADHALVLEVDGDVDTAVLGGVPPVVTPLTVQVGRDEVSLGKVRVEFDDPHVVSQTRLANGHTRVVLTTKDGSVRYVRHDGGPG